MSALDEVWYGTGIAARLARSALAPVSWVYGAGASLRARKFRDADAIHPSSLPALSIGNVTVGGTGKTPVAAWAARALQSRGARPAVVMRGYGDDEPLVHARLNPGVPVVVDPDRVAGVRKAKEQGADCVILDDAFQHRRIGRVSDWVLVSADRWANSLRLLPAGPLREPMDALARANVLVITRKHATLEAADAIGKSLITRHPNLDLALCHLAPAGLCGATSEDTLPLSWLKGRRLLVTAAVGDPQAFVAQLRAHGAELQTRLYRDHHAFTPRDATELARRAEGLDGVVCTLKDAVKLGPLWPAAAPALWYVSQIAVIERGSPLLDRALDAVLAARQAGSSTAGPAGQSSPNNGHRSSIADR